MNARKAERLHELIVTASANLNDCDASEAPELFHRLREDGGLINSGTRINWNGTVKRAVVNLWDTTENNPENAPALWADLEYINGIRKIPADPIPATKQFSFDELGWWDGKVYRSRYNGNVYSPALVPANWEQI